MIATTLLVLALLAGQPRLEQPGERQKAELLLPRPSFEMTVEQRKSEPIPGSRDTVHIRLGDISKGRTKITIMAKDNRLVDSTMVKQGDELKFVLNGCNYTVRISELRDLIPIGDFAILTVSSSDVAALAHPPDSLKKPPTLKLGDSSVLETIYIPPGEFVMGRDRTIDYVAIAIDPIGGDDFINEGPPHKVTITKGYFIGRYKVTNEQYCEFLNSIEAPERHRSGSGILNRDGKYVPIDGRERSAVSGVSWNSAQAFCAWATKQTGRTIRLPTEAEWDFAARGVERREMPWGFRELDTWWELRAAVDAFPKTATPDGVVGMIDGALGEWCSDIYALNYPKEAQIDPQGPDPNKPLPKPDIPFMAQAGPGWRVLRGRSSVGQRAMVRDGKPSGDATTSFRVLVEVADKK